MSPEDATKLAIAQLDEHDQQEWPKIFISEKREAQMHTAKLGTGMAHRVGHGGKWSQTSDASASERAWACIGKQATSTRCWLCAPRFAATAGTRNGNTAAARSSTASTSGGWHDIAADDGSAKSTARPLDAGQAVAPPALPLKTRQAAVAVEPCTSTSHRSARPAANSYVDVRYFIRLQILMQTFSVLNPRLLIALVFDNRKLFIS